MAWWTVHTKASIEGLVAVHSVRWSQSLAMGEEEALSSNEIDVLPPVPHQLVPIHEPTGRPTLFIGRHAWHVEGMGLDESRDLLDRLLELACQPPRVYTHRWAEGDLVLWDNRCMLHKGHPWDTAEPRVMKRTTVAGDPAPGDQNEWALGEPAAVG